MTTTTVLGRLRAATRLAHERLEAELDIFSALATTEGRRDLVRRFHALHAGADAALSDLLWMLPGLDYPHRRRSPHLERDLWTLGETPPPPAPHPEPACVAEALGQLYVLEGSTLGGKLIRQRLAREGGGMTGLSFLDPYGAHAGPRWKQFLAVLERECPPEDMGRGAAAVRGGLLGFETARRRLCPEAAA